MTGARTAATLAAAALAAAAAAGCGEKRENVGGGSTVTSVGADTTVEVTETGFAIDPASPEIAKTRHRRL